MIFLQVLTLEFYAEFSPIWRAVNGGGFLLDIATPSRVWLHIEAEYTTVILAVLLAVLIIKKRKQ